MFWKVLANAVGWMVPKRNLIFILMFFYCGIIYTYIFMLLCSERESYSYYVNEICYLKPPLLSYCDNKVFKIEKSNWPIKFFMMDSINGVFRSQDKIIYKRFFSGLEADELNDLFNEITISSISSSLATGLREHIDINLDQQSMITERILVVLQDYFPDMCMDRYCRFYSHKYGGVKPHIDKSHDNQCNYTLLIYLTDDFDDGKLSIKTKRTDEDRERLEPNKFHHVFTITPIKGYGIIFDKSLLHWADEVIGNKNFLLIHLCSCF